MISFQPFSPTIEDIYVANVDTDRGTRERIRFIDTEGIDDDRIKELPRHLLTIADGFVIVYAIDDEHSFQIAEVIRKDIERNKEKKEVLEVTEKKYFETWTVHSQKSKMYRAFLSFMRQTPWFPTGCSCFVFPCQVTILTLGNKLDLSGRRQVESVQALNWASREKIKLAEVSSLDRESLKEPFVHLSSKLNPPPNKSSFSQHLTIGRKQPKTSES